jgi:predicted CXXCH cytochrome family protein
MIITRGIIIGTCMLVLMTGNAGALSAKKRPDVPSPSSLHECSDCHVETALSGPGMLKQKPSSLCFTCHPDRQAPAEHRVDVEPGMTVRDLPLFENRMTCVTCHDPHSNPHGSLLRKPEADLCLSCHPY